MRRGNSNFEEPFRFQTTFSVLQMFYKSLDGSKTPQQHLELNRICVAIFGLVENIL